MRRFPRLSALALATGMAASPAAAIDPFFPTFGNNGINVIHYDLDLEVAPGPGTLDGRAEPLSLPRSGWRSFRSIWQERANNPAPPIRGRASEGASSYGSRSRLPAPQQRASC
jgi:hypothetical protein